MGKVEKKSQADKTNRQVEPARKAQAVSSNTRKTASRFLANFLSVERYKPAQGFTFRTGTAVALGVVIGAGLLRLSQTLEAVTTPAWASQPFSRLGLPLLLSAAAAWFIFRLVNQEDFAEFLIATEAEMHKVSWTSKGDLKRATTVVLVTVILMTTYIWLVDQVWSTVLRWVGVLRI